MKITEMPFRSFLRKLTFYGICGGSGVMLDLLVYAGLLHMAVNYQLANVAGYLSGTVLSFFLNRAITFNVLDKPVQRFATFFAVACIGLVLSAATLWCLVTLLGVGAFVAKIMSLVVVVATQFSLNFLITFRASDRSEPTCIK